MRGNKWWIFFFTLLYAHIRILTYTPWHSLQFGQKSESIFERKLVHSSAISTSWLGKYAEYMPSTLRDGANCKIVTCTLCKLGHSIHLNFPVKKAGKCFAELNSWIRDISVAVRRLLTIHLKTVRAPRVIKNSASKFHESFYHMKSRNT